MIIKRVETYKELQDAFDVRKQVFVQEQNIPLEIEQDEHEHDSVHFVVYKNEAPIGAARIREINREAKIERVCVVKKHRSDGVGRKLMKAIEDYAAEQKWLPIRLHAQLDVVPFYEKLGYQIESEPFYEAGIPHYAMKK